MTTSATARRTALTVIGLVLAATLLVAACGGDDKVDSSTKDATTTTAKSGEKAVAFADAIDNLQQQVEDAKGNVCDLIKAVQAAATGIAEPKSTDDVKKASLFTVAYMNGLADGASAELAKEADVLRETAKSYASEVEAAGYTPESLSGSEAFQSKDFVAASQKVQSEIAGKCGISSGSTTTSGAG